MGCGGESSRAVPAGAVGSTAKERSGVWRAGAGDLAETVGAAEVAGPGEVADPAEVAGPSEVDVDDFDGDVDDFDGTGPAGTATVVGAGLPTPAAEVAVLAVGVEVGAAVPVGGAVPPCWGVICWLSS